MEGGRSDRPPARSTNWRKLMPDTAERITEKAGIPRKYPLPNSAKTMSYSSVRHEACLPTAGRRRRVVRRRAMITGESVPLTKRPEWRSSPGRSTRRKSPHQKSRRRARRRRWRASCGSLTKPRNRKSRTRARRPRSWLAVLRGTRRRGGAAVARVVHGVQHRCSRTRSLAVLVIACRTLRSDSGSVRGRDQLFDGCQNGMLIRDRIAMEEAEPRYGDIRQDRDAQ